MQTIGQLALGRWMTPGNGSGGDVGQQRTQWTLTPEPPRRDRVLLSQVPSLCEALGSTQYCYHTVQHPPLNPQRRFEIHLILLFLILYFGVLSLTQPRLLHELCMWLIKDDFEHTGECHPRDPKVAFDRVCWQGAEGRQAPPPNVHITPVLLAFQRVQRHHPPSVPERL